LDYKVNGQGAKAKVIDSMVSIEIENGKGKFLTVQRSIAGDRNHNLMTVYERRRSRRKRLWARRGINYVQEGGAAINELGFTAGSRTSSVGNYPWRRVSTSRTARSIWRRYSRCFMWN
jgi:hypothetical protein